MSDATSAGKDHPAGPCPEADRRAVERHASDALISFHPLALSKKDSLAALIKDVSPRGISLIVKHRFAPGTLLAIDLGDLGGSRPAPVLARVIHVTPRGKGKWVVGCALQEELSQQQVAAFRAEPDGGSWVRVARAPRSEGGW
jgi:PilZ domain